MSREVSSSKQELLSMNSPTLSFLFPNTGHLPDLENSYNTQNMSYILHSFLNYCYYCNKKNLVAENTFKMLVSDVLHIALVHYSKNKTDNVLYSMSKTQAISILLNKPQLGSELDYWTMIILFAYLLVPLLAQF